MSKDTIPLVAEDISTFSKALSRQLRAQPALPSHLGLMNMLARSAGFRNFQHLRAAHAAKRRLNTEAPAETVDHRLVERALNQFDAEGSLTRWPSKQSVQDLCLWALWSHIPADQAFTEREISALLDARHHFQDAAILRRSMVTLKMLGREIDGTNYRRIEQRPPPEARALIYRLKQ